MAKKTETVSPLMKQHAELKRKFPDAMLLFRVGDFYETFNDDARRASEILGITLTRKSSGNHTYADLAGIPYHALDQYLPRLVRAGLRVAICEQLEDPKTTKGLVKRGITELVTPGVTYNDMVLERKENNFLCALHIDERMMGVSFLDVSTGEFYVAQGDADYVGKLMTNFRPAEVVVERRKQRWLEEHMAERYYVNTFDDWVFTLDFARELLLKQFGTASLKGFGVEELEAGLVAAGAVLHYLNETQHTQTSNITRISRVEEDRYVWLDKFTVRNLELVWSANEGARTLFDVLDHTLSPMGARLLKRWMLMPLREKAEIEGRLTVVDALVRDGQLREKLRQQVRLVGDLERLVTKAAVGRLNPREALQLGRALAAVAEVKNLCAAEPRLGAIGEQLNPCQMLAERIGRELVADPPVKTDKGGFIADGVDDELDELRSISGSGRDYLMQLQQKESEATGIPSLKIGFNNIFGYYFEVYNTHKDKVPEHWTRRQTLTNAERYITPELKEYEDKILGAEEKIVALEAQIYARMLAAVAEYISPLQTDASLLARIDCLQGFAEVAIEGNYCRPVLSDSTTLRIVQGRHPVIETQMPVGEKYVPNDVLLDPDDSQIIIITGPNMSGKSALLRQTALIVLMAQMGSYCPAKEAEVGVVDKVFTRVGASDNISSGESTFMVEMNETASILNNITPRSLVLLDEIGRGTSTYDGISIAWAITEYLHENASAHPKVMFATHYHELIEMDQYYPRIRNFHVSVKDIDGRVIFLRTLTEGGSEHSFGIHVAKLAGMPPKVVTRAGEMLAILEAKNKRTVEPEESLKNPKKAPAPSKNGGLQLSFIQLDDPTLLEIRSKLQDVDINTIMPINALLILNEIKEIVAKK